MTTIVKKLRSTEYSFDTNATLKVNLESNSVNLPTTSINKLDNGMYVIPYSSATQQYLLVLEGFVAPASVTIANAAATLLSTLGLAEAQLSAADYWNTAPSAAGTPSGTTTSTVPPNTVMRLRSSEYTISTASTPATLNSSLTGTVTISNIYSESGGYLALCTNSSTTYAIVLEGLTPTGILPVTPATSDTIRGLTNATYTSLAAIPYTIAASGSSASSGGTTTTSGTGTSSGTGATASATAGSSSTSVPDTTIVTSTINSYVVGGIAVATVLLCAAAFYLFPAHRAAATGTAGLVGLVALAGYSFLNRKK